jgi:ribosomal-protein-alanine N-acetyltransferase
VRSALSKIPDLNNPLSDGPIRLRLAAERDIPEVLVAHQDDHLMYASLGMKRPPSGAEIGRQLEQAPGDRAAGNQVTLTILDRESEDCRGQLDAYEFDWDNARAELSIWVVPQARGRGFARAGLKLGAGWLFESCGIERVQLLSSPGNEPLLRAATAAGFHTEGTLRGHQLQAGRPADQLILSLLPADLAAAR